MDRKILAIAISAAMHAPPADCDEAIKTERVGLNSDGMKANMSFYQSKTHHKKKNNKVNFR